MIVFASRIREPDSYRDHAAPGLARAAEAGAEIHPFLAAGTVCSDYNLMLDELSDRAGLEALVLIDQDTEITDPDFCAKVRAALADQDVALVGCAGASGVEGPAWWEGAVSAAPLVRAYEQYGGGRLDGFVLESAGSVPAQVDTVAGFLLVLSPWAARTLRFDEALHVATGFELDYALRAREAGKTVVTADLRVVYHGGLDVVDDLDLWVEGHIALAEKWDGRLPGAPPRPADWKERARLAEAERDAARARAYSEYSRREAQLLPLQREFERMSGTLGWRLTEPLRRLNAARRRARDGSRRAR
jgi:glycosyl transferase family 2